MKRLLLALSLSAAVSAHAGMSAADASFEAMPKKRAIPAKNVISADEARVARDGTIIIGKRELDRSSDVAGALRRVPYIFVRRR